MAEREIAAGGGGDVAMSEDYLRQARREGMIGALAGAAGDRGDLPDGHEAGSLNSVEPSKWPPAASRPSRRRTTASSSRRGTCRASA